MALAILLVFGGFQALGGGCKRPAQTGAALAIVAGRVMGPQGQPLSGAPVTLAPDPDDGRVPVASARTDAQGWFRLERVPSGRFELRARAPGHVEMARPIETGVSGTGVVEMRLPAAVTLAGRIEDSRHAPIPLARVVAFAAGDAEKRKLHETQSDEHGAFSIGDLAPGPHRLLIEAPGLGAASAGPVTAPDTQVVVILPGEIRALSGRVVRDGQPAAGAKVRLGGESVLEPRGTETDAAGRFVFAGLGPGSYVVRAELGALVSPVTVETVGDGPPTAPGRMELALAPGRYAGGVVTDEAGRPVTGATVQLDLVPPTGLWAPVPTDGQGRWVSSPLPPGSYRVRARRPGFVARRTAAADIGAAGGPGPTTLAVKLELVRTARITGIVVNERNVPLAGATVHDRPDDAEELGVIWSRLPLAAEAAALPSGSVLPSLAAADAAGSRRVTTDGAGRFGLRDVAPGRVRVEVLSPGAVPLRTAPFTIAPGADVNLGTLRLQGAIQVGGTVLDDDGSPLGGVRVSAAASGEAASAANGLYALTGPDGAFSLPLGAGEHRITASERGRPDVSATVRVEAGASPPSVTLRFAKGGNLVVTGVVKDTAGRALARARVAARPADGDEGASAGTATTVTDAGGGFRLTGVSPGLLRVEVMADAYGLYRTTLVPEVAAAEGRPVTLTIPIPGAIEGEVHEKITGAPVVGFLIEAEGPEAAKARFPESGGRRRGADPLRFSLRKLTPGRWTLQVRAAGFQPLVHQVDVPPASTPGDPTVRSLRLELARQ